MIFIVLLTWKPSWFCRLSIKTIRVRLVTIISDHNLDYLARLYTSPSVCSCHSIIFSLSAFVAWWQVNKCWLLDNALRQSTSAPVGDPDLYLWVCRVQTLQPRSVQVGQHRWPRLTGQVPAKTQVPTTSLGHASTHRYFISTYEYLQV